MFHFELVHVPGAFHGPDGLLRRRPQPGDRPEPADDFDDWIDQVHGFMHMIHPLSSLVSDQPPATVYMLTGSAVQENDKDDLYDQSHNYKTKPEFESTKNS